MITAKMIAPILRLTGYRFSKDYRHGVTRWHRMVYAVVSTPTANLAAGMSSTEWRRQEGFEPSL